MPISRPTQPPCPRCGHPVDRYAGVIADRVIGPYFTVERRARPAVFWACAHCEWCGEQLTDNEGAREADESDDEPEPASRCLDCGQVECFCYDGRL